MIMKEVTGAKAYCNPGDALIKCNCAAAAIIVYLASCKNFTNAPLIKKTDSSANTVKLIAAKDEYLEGGTYQVETATVTGTITGSGNATVIVTAAEMEGTPITFSIPVTSGETAAIVAARIRLFLGANKNLSDVFTVSGSGATVVLTQRQYTGNDSTLNISIDNGTCTGLSTAATSADTTTGVAVTLAEQYDYKQFIPTDTGWGLGDSNLVDTTLDNITVTTINKYTLTAPAAGATLTILNGKTFTVNNTMTLAADADSKTLNFGAYNLNFDTSADSTLTLPTTGTLATLAGEETFTNKTLTTPIIASLYQDAGKTKLMTIPDTASDTLAAIAAEQTFTNKTLTTPIIASFYQDAGKTKLMTVPDTASDTIATLAATQAFTNKTYNKVTITAPANGSTLTILDGKVLTVNNSITLAAGAESKTLNIGANNITFSTSGATTLTLPATGTLSTLAGTEELTNKTITSATITTPILQLKDVSPVNAVASTLSTSLVGADNDLVYTALTKGVAGDSISIAYVDPGTPSAALSVAVVGDAITVNLATDAGTQAEVDIGGGVNGTVTITKDEVGTVYNSDTAEVVLGTSPSGALSAAIVDGDVTVTLGMDAGTAASGTLTVADNATNDVIDTEIVTIGGDEIYEFDWDGSYTGVRNQVDISGAASIAKAKGTMTLTGMPAHNETFVVDATTMTIKHDGTTGANIVDLTACATAEYGSGDFGVVGVPADGETITINARVYEFDTNAGIGGDVAIDISAATTVDEVLTAIETAINGDGGADVTAAKNLTENYVTVTAKVIGTASNYAVAEACTSGAWMPGRGSAGNLVDGANATVEEIVDQIVADFDGSTATATKKDADEVYFEYNAFGTAGNIIVFTEALSNCTIDGAGVLGTTTAGADCSKEDAVAALTAKINAVTAKSVTAVDNLDGTMTLTADDVGTAGNSIGTTEGMAQGSWGGAATLQGGLDIAADNAKNTATLVAGAVTALSGVSAAASGTGADPLTGIEGPTAFSGGVDPAITSTAAEVEAAVEIHGTAGTMVSAANKGGDTGAGVVTAMAAANLASGVDGTVGLKGYIYIDDSYIYVCSADNTIADGNWKQVAISSY